MYGPVWRTGSSKIIDKQQPSASCSHSPDLPPAASMALPSLHRPEPHTTATHLAREGTADDACARPHDPLIATASPSSDIPINHLCTVPHPSQPSPTSLTTPTTSCAGSISIPAVQLPSALQAPAEEFQRQYRCARPAAEDLVVVYSRTHTRAAWAAQVAADAGLLNCFVLLQVQSPSTGT